MTRRTRAAGDYLKKRTRAEEIEAYFAAYEKYPEDRDEDLRAIAQWNAEHFGEIIDELEKGDDRW